MKYKKQAIPYKKERAVLSDALPFEIPAIFSNRDFYRFLIRYRVTYKDQTLQWRSGGLAIDVLIKLLFSIDQSKPIKKKFVVIDKVKIGFSWLDFNLQSMSSKPFLYKIRHNEDSFRELAIPHPVSQLRLIYFYEEFKESILYYANLSNNSLRKPFKVASHVYYTDNFHIDHFDSLSEIETYEAEYENLKSFFVYRKYGNIHKFYESPDFHCCEQKYNKLLKLDISKCFDSIYTHSATWAIYGKGVVKKRFLEKQDKVIKGTFGDCFDSFMQSINARETNGIVIGPEVSRIFAELILQAVDINLDKALLEKHQALKPGIDFELYRYIDDYFIFFNHDDAGASIIESLQHELREYKLHLNEGKRRLYSKPIITEITIAKEKILNLLTDMIFLEVKQDIDDKKTGKIYMSSKRAIVDFKTIIKETKVEYKDLLNWTLALIESKFDGVLRRYLRVEHDDAIKAQLSSFIINLLDFVFFIYSVTPRVNTTLRLCRIITKLNIFARKHCVGWSLVDAFQRKIYDNAVFLFRKFTHEDITQVETLYLLIQLSEMDDEYRLTANQLIHYFGIDASEFSDKACKRLNYFAITALLFYMKSHSEYTEIKQYIEKVVELKLTSPHTNIAWDAESNLLLVDILFCPYVSEKLKFALLKQIGVASSAFKSYILKSKQNMFTNWHNFDIQKALDSKKSLEVY